MKRTPSSSFRSSPPRPASASAAAAGRPAPPSACGCRDGEHPPEVRAVAVPKFRVRHHADDLTRRRVVHGDPLYPSSSASPAPSSSSHHSLPLPQCGCVVTVACRSPSVGAPAGIRRCRTPPGAGGSCSPSVPASRAGSCGTGRRSSRTATSPASPARCQSPRWTTVGGQILQQARESDPCLVHPLDGVRAGQQPVLGDEERGAELAAARVADPGPPLPVHDATTPPPWTPARDEAAPSLVARASLLSPGAAARLRPTHAVPPGLRRAMRRRLPSSLVPRSSVQAPPRASGPLMLSPAPLAAAAPRSSSPSGAPRRKSSR